MSAHIVIARYEEDISWIQEFKTDITVYNKGSRLNSISNNLKIIETENKGREAKTYLDYIVSNYNDLPDRIIFTQGRPNDHVSHDFIKDFINFLDSNLDFHYLSIGLLKIEKTKTKGIWREYGNLPHGYWTNNHSEESPCIKDIIKRFPKSVETGWEFGAGAIFGVSSKRIKERDLEFYNGLSEYLDSSENIVNPIEAHVLERMWGLIFN